MIGAIIGDIVGSRFEFKNHRSTEFDLFTRDCSFTDDTICTIAVAEALVHNYSFEEAFMKWCHRYPHPKGGYGGSFLEWLRSPNPQPYNSFGNGSAMRVSPCAWISDDRDVVLKLARESAECTHNHPDGIRGAVCVADCIWHARMGASKDDIRNLVTREYYCIGTTCEYIRRTNTFNETCHVTVPQAIVAFLESSNFVSAIRLAVSIGGDSDTIAAITGSIAEAFYGVPVNVAFGAAKYLPHEFFVVISDFNDKCNGRL